MYAKLHLRALVAAGLLAVVPLGANAGTAATQTVVSMSVSGSSCSISNSSNPSFGTLTNPITTEQSTTGSISISCGSSSPALKIAFNDAGNSGTYNYTMTNSTTTTATQAFQICDYNQFINTGTTCPNGFEYKNTAADTHAISAGSQSYNFEVYFTPPAAGLNLAGGTYFDTVTSTITF